MATSNIITRRFALLGGAASTAALAVPAAHAVAAEKSISERVRYHATELAKALREQRGGSWKVTNLESTDTITGIVMFVGHRGKDDPNSIPQL